MKLHDMRIDESVPAQRLLVGQAFMHGDALFIVSINNAHQFQVINMYALEKGMPNAVEENFARGRAVVPVKLDVHISYDKREDRRI